MLDNSLIKNNWRKIKPLVLSHWKKLSESEVEKTHGSISSLGKLVQAKYGSNANFEKEYEQICWRIADKNKTPDLYAGKTPGMRDLSKQTLGETGFNEPDDEDEDGLTNFDESSANYTGLGLSEAEADQEEFLKPDLHGMDAAEAQSNPVVETISKQKTANMNRKNKPKKTAPDEFKPNQDPRSSKREDIKLGRSNSSANTTSSSALTSSEATKKL